MTGLTIIVTAAVLTAQAASLPTLESLNLSCTDFKQNSQGWWSPTHPISLGVMTLTAASYFHAGDSVGGRNGVDLGAILDKECKPKS
ncbi:MAG TPA: hypothetical protein VKV32_08405 [Stellaceae bacterium]|nr:hypothetical protein [Stellaceae bacterium]